MLNSQFKGNPTQTGGSDSSSVVQGSWGSEIPPQDTVKPRNSRRGESVTVPASPIPTSNELNSPMGNGEDLALTVEQLQAEVNRCQAELKAAEREGSLRAGLIRKLCEDLREPISNINMAVRMMGQASSETEQIRYGSILRTECARQLEILNNVNRMQVVMGTYGTSRPQ